MKTYIFDYRYKGETWSFEITAESVNDAQQIIRALPWCKYVGEKVLETRSPLIARLTVWMMNLWRGIRQALKGQRDE